MLVSHSQLTSSPEYIFYYYFYQDGNVELEIRLTGILQVYVKGDDEPNPFGTTVAPNINAQYHQHIFCLRLDPMIDGLNNTVVETDVIPLDAPTGSIYNFAGNAFITRETIIKTQKEGAREYDLSKDRRWIITNPDHQHPASKKNVGYAIGMKGGVVQTLAKPDSVVVKRAGFISKDLWVVKEKEGPKGSARMWPAGKYVPGTRGEDTHDIITKWVQGDDNIAGEDIIVFASVGAYISEWARPFFLHTAHLVLTETRHHTYSQTRGLSSVSLPFTIKLIKEILIFRFPLRMPAETLKVVLKPFHFFTSNPALDVPGANDTHSVPAFPTGETCCPPN